MGDRTALTSEQIAYLLAPIDPRRVSKDGKGFAHVEAWEIRRTLIRVFGHGGFSTELQDAQLVRELELPAGKTSRWTVIYRATVVLVVRVNGQELARYHGTAIGEAINQPSLADAHDLALKTADSQAFKRAAVNLGDQFGLSLYDKGSTAAVVVRSLAYSEQPAEQPQQAPAVNGPTAEQLSALADGTMRAAADTADSETLRALYVKAAEVGLLSVAVNTTAGPMELGAFLTARGQVVAAAGSAVTA